MTSAYAIPYDIASAQMGWDPVRGLAPWPVCWSFTRLKSGTRAPHVDQEGHLDTKRGAAEAAPRLTAVLRFASEA
jgi:hypothetical protein